MAGSVTVKDVAREAEVSIGTVSRVFNNHSNVTEEVRQRVLKAASDLGYFGPGSQDGRVRENSRALKEIGFLYYSRIDPFLASTNPFWPSILHGVENQARKLNIKVTYRMLSDLSPQTMLTAIYEMKLGGILLVGPAETEIIQLVRSTKLPLVLVDNYQPGLSVDAVICDNFQGARMAVEYLLNEGHRDIAFICGPLVADAPRPINSVYSVERRAAGYRTALLDAGLPVNYQLLEVGTLQLEGGYQACKRLLARNIPFSALFCANDETAIGALKALREANLRVPEDVSLVGFDDIDMVEHLTPPLTTVHVNKEALGSVALKRLVERAADMEAVSVTSVLEVELIKRTSVIAYNK